MGLLLTSVIASSMLPFRSRIGMRGGHGLVEMTVAAREDETSSVCEEALCKVFLGLCTFTGLWSLPIIQLPSKAAWLGLQFHHPFPPIHSGSSLLHPSIPMTLHACLRCRVALS